jgi:DUF177 domain-containing protein
VSRPPFLVPTGELFRHPGARQHLTLAGPLPGLALSTTWLTSDDVVADVVVEAQGEAVMLTGSVTAAWTGECRRCLETTGGEIRVELREIFEPHPTEGETYPLDRDDLDLEPVLREALALALPLAPVCREDCPGPDPDAHPLRADDEATPADPRWSALDGLRFE